MEIPAYLKHLPGSEPEDAYIPYIRRGENEEPNLSPEEEEQLIKEQVFESDVSFFFLLHSFMIDLSKSLKI